VFSPRGLLDQDVQFAEVVVESRLVDQERVARLHQLIRTIQGRWGQHALRLFGQTPATGAIPVISTSFPDLDAALAIGGLPRGRITEVLAMPTSGATAIVLRAVALAQQRGDCVGYIDMHSTFDAEYAVWCGVSLETLLLVRPRQPADALNIIFALVVNHGLGVLVVDDLALLQETAHGAAALSAALRALTTPLASSPCALVVLTPLPFRAGYIRSVGLSGSALAHAAALRLHVAREAWLDDEDMPFSCRTRMTVLRSKFAAPEATADVTISFVDTWRVS
jgi:recombination protein RecA